MIKDKTEPGLDPLAFEWGLAYYDAMFLDRINPGMECHDPRDIAASAQLQDEALDRPLPMDMMQENAQINHDPNHMIDSLESSIAHPEGPLDVSMGQDHPDIDPSIDGPGKYVTDDLMDSIEDQIIDETGQDYTIIEQDIIEIDQMDAIPEEFDEYIVKDKIRERGDLDEIDQLDPHTSRQSRKNYSEREYPHTPRSRNCRLRRLPSHIMRSKYKRIKLAKSNLANIRPVNYCTYCGTRSRRDMCPRCGHIVKCDLCGGWLIFGFCLSSECVKGQMYIKIFEKFDRDTLRLIMGEDFERMTRGQDKDECCTGQDNPSRSSSNVRDHRQCTGYDSRAEKTTERVCPECGGRKQDCRCRFEY